MIVFVPYWRIYLLNRLLLVLDNLSDKFVSGVLTVIATCPGGAFGLVREIEK